MVQPLPGCHTSLLQVNTTSTSWFPVAMSSKTATFAHPWTSLFSREGFNSHGLLPFHNATNIYSGVIVPSSPSFVATITMSLARNPEGSGSGGSYRMVADRVQLILKSPDINGTSANGGGGAGSKAGFGFLEWPLSVNSIPSTSAGILPNITQTPLDIAGFDLFNALGGSTNLSSGAFVNDVVQHTSGTLFLAGQFSLASGAASGASNIVAFGGGALHVLSNNGLNGNVSALLLVGNQLYVGGHFTDTSTGSTDGALSGVAVYDVVQDQWTALGGGVDGTVSGLGYTDGRVQVVGNFTRVRNSRGDTEGLQVPGLASWVVEAGGWTSSGGYLVGSLDIIANGTDNKNTQDVQYVAGHITSSLRYGANGFALLATGQDGGLPEVTTLDTTLEVNTDAHIINNGPTHGLNEVGVEDGIVSLEPNNDFSMGASFAPNNTGYDCSSRHSEPSSASKQHSDLY